MPRADRTWSNDIDTARRIAKRFMGVQQGRTPWHRFLHGLVATWEIKSDLEPKALGTFLKAFPTPESARVFCDEKRADVLQEFRAIKREHYPSGIKGQRLFESVKRNVIGEYVFGVRNREDVLEAVCDAAARWDQVETLLTECATASEDLTPSCSIGGHDGTHPKGNQACKDGCGPSCKVKGFRLKGGDLVRLFEGCDVPVMDQWMLWHLAPDVEPNVERPPRDTRAKRGERNDASAFRAPMLNFAGPIQTDPDQYKRYRDEAIRQARVEGLSPAEWHYATWLDLVTCQVADPDTGECLKSDIRDAETFIDLLAEVQSPSQKAMRSPA